MIELHPDAVAHGGEAVARVEGKAHFVEGAMPGERVRGEVVKDGGSWARVELRQILEPSPHRIEPPCPHFGVCGGCQWQFADYSSQLAWKRDILAGQLAHLGKIAEPPVRDTVVVGPPFGYRNRADFRVSGGRLAFHRRRSHDLEAIDECLLLHPTLAELRSRIGDLGETTAITLRVAVTTGEKLAVIEGQVPASAADWGCSVSYRRRSRLTAVIGDGAIRESVAGVTFRITGDAFFQNNTAGAGSLVELVSEALVPRVGDTLLDAYAGGGLFGITVGRGVGAVVAVESDPVAVSDLRHNAESAGVPVRIVEGAVEQAVPMLGGRWDLAVIDPPRDGLGLAGVAAITIGRPRSIAYVSCDPASLARDSRYLGERGYHLEWAAPVDLFPQTFHIETVAAFSAG